MKALVLLSAMLLLATEVPAETIRSKDIEVTVDKDGCGLVDEVKFKGQVVMSTKTSGHAPVPGYEMPPETVANAKKLADALKALDVNAPCKVTEATSPRGQKLYTLENGLLKVVVLPWFGGRIIRLESKLNGVNFLDDPYEDRPGDIKKPEDIGGIWGELDGKIFEAKFEKQTPDEIVMTLTGVAEDGEGAGKKTTKLVKTLTLRKGSPALALEHRMIAVEGTQRLTNNIFARFRVGASVGVEDVLWGSTRGESVHAVRLRESPNIYMDPRQDHFAAQCDSKEGAAVVTSFDGPVIRIGSWFQPTSYQMEWWTAEYERMDAGKEIATKLQLVPCFNMPGVTFASGARAIGVLPETDAVGAAARSLRAHIWNVSFRPDGRPVPLHAVIEGADGRVVKNLPDVTLAFPFMVGGAQDVEWPIADLPPGDYRLVANLEVNMITTQRIPFRKLAAGPVLETFAPAKEDAASPFPVLGSATRAKVEVLSVAKTGPTTLRVTGRLGSSPYSADIALTAEGDGFEVKHTLTANAGAERIRAVGLELPLALGTDYFRVKTTVGGDTLNDAWRVNMEDELVDTQTVSDYFSRWPLWRLGGVFQDSPAHYRIWKSSARDTAPTPTLEGKSAPGWVEASNFKWSARFEMPDMAKNAPKSIVVDGHAGLAQAWFYPPQSPPLVLKSSGDPAAPSVADRMGWKAGAPWINTLVVRFHEGPHPRGFKREITDAGFRAFLEAMGELSVTRSVRAVALPPGDYEQCIRSILDSDLTFRQYVRRAASSRYVLQPACQKLKVAYSNDVEQTIDALIEVLKDK